MSILQMSIQAGVLIIAIVLIRAIALNKLPKNTFLALWGVALVRLLVPFSFSSRFSIYSLIDNGLAHATANMPSITAAELPQNNSAVGGAEVLTTPTQAIGQQPFSIDPIVLIWIIGMVAAFIFFGVVYWRNCRELRFAWIVRENKFIIEWLNTHKLLRPLTVLQSDRLTTPITVGNIRPRIILPKAMDMKDEQLLRYVLTHEYYHIRRFDALWKLLIIFTLCVHWFNPLVWIMVILINRDLEITCDEMVVRHFGADAKKAYAYSLIYMAEQRSKLAPLFSGFSKNAAEERITAIMKYKKTSIVAGAVALLLVATLIMGFTTTAASTSGENSNMYPTSDTDFMAEYNKLLELRFDNYENMTIDEYRNQVYDLIGQDEQMWMALLEKAVFDEKMIAQVSTNNDAYFIQSILIPLLAEKWQTQHFRGVIQSNGAMVEYEYSYQIMDGKQVTVLERNNAIADIQDILNAVLNEKTVEQLSDDGKMMDELAGAVDKWKSADGNDHFQLACSYHYLFEDTGRVNDEGTVPDRNFPPATKEQYDWVLSLMKDGYKNMSVAQFNALYEEIIAQSDYDSEVFDALAEDVYFGTSVRSLTDEEAEFIRVTFAATGCEFATRHQQDFSDEARLPWFDGYAVRDDEGIYAAVNYTIEYEILNEQNLTVKERDNMLIGISSAMQSFIDSQPQEALADGKALIEAEIERLETQYSNNNLRVVVSGLHYQFNAEQPLS